MPDQENLTEEQVLADAGVDDIAQVRELYARRRALRRLESFDSDLFKRLIFLDVCSVAENQLTELTPLSDCWSLRELNISKNRVTSLLPLASCGTLAVLYASQNLIGNLKGLEKLPLKTLHFASNQALADLNLSKEVYE